MNQWLITLSPWTETISARLWNASWQGAIAIALAWGIIRGCTFLPPRVACWIWRLACLKLLVALIWISPLGIPVLPASAAASSDAITTVRLSRPRNAAIDAPLANPSADATVARPLAGLSLVTVLCLAWFFGVLVRMLGTWRQWLAIGRLRRSLLEADELLVGLCRQQAEQLGIVRLPRLGLSKLAATPLLTGIWRPTIILPASAAHNFDRRELELMLAHELAHLKRRDLLWNWLPTVAGWLFYFHPLVWLLGRRWSESQETACDELVLRHSQVRASEYGRLLVKLATHWPGEARLSPAMAGVLGGYRMLERRIASLGQLPVDSLGNLAAGAALAALIGILGIVPWRLEAQAAPPAQTAASAKEKAEPGPPAAEQKTTGTVEFNTFEFQVDPQTSEPKPRSAEHQEATQELQKLGAQVVPATKGGVAVVIDQPWTGNEDQLQLLGKLDGIEILVMNCEKLPDTALAAVKSIKSIDHLQCLHASDRQLAELKGDSSIRNLALSCDRMSDAGLETVGTFANLTNLNLFGWNSENAEQTPLTDAGLSELVHCKKLAQLSLSACPKITGHALGELAVLPELRTLWLYNVTLDDVALQEIARLRQVTKLTLMAKEITAAGYAPLAAMKQLEHLSLNDAVHFDDAAAACLRGLTALRRLDIFEGAWSDAGLANLTPLTRLQQLNIWQGQFSDAGLEHLKHLSSLRLLNISGDNVHFSDQGLRQLAGLTRLKQLVLSRAGITDAGLSALAGLQDLELLDISGSRVRGPGLATLSELSKISALDLSSTSIDDAGLARLTNFPALKTLTLDDTAITDAGLATLAKLPQLMRLNLRCEKITPAGLEALVGLKMLRELKLASEAVTPDAAKQLQQQHPGLAIDNRAWRKGGEVEWTITGTFEPLEIEPDDDDAETP